MVDERRLRRILEGVKERVSQLHAEAVEPSAVRADFHRLTAVKYLFVTAIEGCIDAAHHVIASEGLGRTETNSDAMRLLASGGVMPKQLGEVMALAVGFRNLLVHQYADVDDERVIAYLSNLDNLSDFVAAVAAYVERSSAG